MTATKNIPIAGPNEPRGGGLLGHATDAECIAACLARIAELEAALRPFASIKFDEPPEPDEGLLVIYAHDSTGFDILRSDIERARKALEL